MLMFPKTKMSSKTEFDFHRFFTVCLFVWAALKWSAKFHPIFHSVSIFNQHFVGTGAITSCSIIKLRANLSLLRYHLIFIWSLIHFFIWSLIIFFIWSLMLPGTGMNILLGIHQDGYFMGLLTSESWYTIPGPWKLYINANFVVLYQHFGNAIPTPW